MTTNDHCAALLNLTNLGESPEGSIVAPGITRQRFVIQILTNAQRIRFQKHQTRLVEGDHYSTRSRRMTRQRFEDDPAISKDITLAINFINKNRMLEVRSVVPCLIAYVARTAFNSSQLTKIVALLTTRCRRNGPDDDGSRQRNRYPLGQNPTHEDYFIRCQSHPSLGAKIL